MAHAVLFGGPSPEHDISILTGLQALRTLAERHRDVVGVYWSKTGDFFSVTSDIEATDFSDGVPKVAQELTLRAGNEGGFFAGGGRFGREKRLDVDAVVMCTHGGPGEDGTIQSTLDLAGISYSGPHVAGAALGMDKWSFAAVVAGAGLPVLPRRLFDVDTEDLGFEGPYILKPRFGGSSIGIDVVADLETARARRRSNLHFERGCIVEPYRADLTDLQIAVRTYPALTLSAIERPLRRTSATEILDYRDKYVGGEGMVSAPRELPAHISAVRAAQIVAMATELARLVDVRGVARLDFLANDDEIYVNEVNTIPGSLSKYLFIDPPLSFDQLLTDLLDEARRRPTHHYSSAGADGLVLRSASSIAAKLA